MAYHELKPSEAAHDAQGKTPLDYTKFGGGAPSEIIDFGYIPNLKKIKPGDIVLFRPEGTPAKTWLPIKYILSVLSGDFAFYIQTAQEKMQPSPHHLWVHAGIYLGRDLMVEAIFPKVAVNSFSKNAAKRCIRIRRLPKTTPKKAYDACIEAVRRTGDPYDKITIIDFCKQYFKYRKIEPDLIKKAFICSELVHKSFIYGIGEVIVNVGNTRIPTPADLSASGFLEDVAVDWLPI